MSIQGMELGRPAVQPARAGRISRPGRREAPAAPERRYDAAEVRGGRPQPPRGSDTEAMLGKLHESGLLEKVSRPLGNGGGSEPMSAEEELTQLHDSLNRMETLRPIPEEGQPYRQPDAELRMRRPDGPRDARPMERAPEGRVYGRPKPQPPQGPAPRGRDDGVFTMKLYSPDHDTGKYLMIGDHKIGLDEDGSILAEMPDGTMRRITFNQDVMDEMVAKGEVWMEGDRPAPRRAEPDLPFGPPPTGAQEQYAGVTRQIFGRQAKEAAEAGVWDAPNGWKADHPRPVMAQNNISAANGMWGAKRIAERMLSYAKQVTGDDPSRIDELKDALKRGIADVEEAWGGEVPDVARETYDAVVKALDDWAAEAGGSIKAGEAPAGAEPANADTQPVTHLDIRAGRRAYEASHTETRAEANAGRAEAEGSSRAGKGNPALVEQLKADLQRQQAKMLDTVREMLLRQGKNISGDGIWRTLASGNFRVDAATKSEAQKNIAEDGYWGVEQTSDRIVQFAAGLAGSSPEMLNKMEEAFEKGYAAAEKKWGGALPGICQQTRERVHEKFEELRKQNRRNTAAVEESEEAAV